MKAILALTLLTGCLASSAQEKDGPVFTDTFIVDEKDLATTGRNPYFILEPGYQLYFESPDKKETPPTLRAAPRLGLTGAPF